MLAPTDDIKVYPGVEIPRTQAVGRDDADDDDDDVIFVGAYVEIEPKTAVPAGPPLDLSGAPAEKVKVKRCRKKGNVAVRKNPPRIAQMMKASRDLAWKLYEQDLSEWEKREKRDKYSVRSKRAILSYFSMTSVLSVFDDSPSTTTLTYREPRITTWCLFPILTFSQTYFHSNTARYNFVGHHKRFRITTHDRSNRGGRVQIRVPRKCYRGGEFEICRFFEQPSCTSPPTRFLEF